MKTKIKQFGKSVVAALVLALTFGQKVSAQLIDPSDCPAGTTCTGDFRSNAISYINYFLSFLGLIAVAFVIYAGILMVTAGGDEEGVKKGKTIITYAAIGIVIVLLAFTIVNFFIGVQQSTG